MPVLTKDKKWFLIMQQEEIERLKNPYERLVYESIKSYSSNGKRQVALSIRDIKKRATIKSTRCVSEKLKSLIGKNIVMVCGKQTRRGGSVAILKLFPLATLNNQSVSLSDTSIAESVSSGHLSVSELKLKLQQSNKVKIDKSIQIIEKEKTSKKTYGNDDVNFVLTVFSRVFQLSRPSDDKPRQWAYLISQKLPPEKITLLMEWVYSQDWGKKLSKLETLFRQIPMFERESSKTKPLLGFPDRGYRNAETL